MSQSPLKAFFGKKFRKYLVVSKKGCTFAPAFEKHAPVAQLVEHLTLNQGVQGSNPCGFGKKHTVIRSLKAPFFNEISAKFLRISKFISNFAAKYVLFCTL